MAFQRLSIHFLLSLTHSNKQTNKNMLCLVLPDTNCFLLLAFLKLVISAGVARALLLKKGGGVGKRDSELNHSKNISKNYHFWPGRLQDKMPQMIKDQNEPFPQNDSPSINYCIHLFRVKSYSGFIPMKSFKSSTLIGYMWN